MSLAVYFFFPISYLYLRWQVISIIIATKQNYLALHIVRLVLRSSVIVTDDGGRSGFSEDSVQYRLNIRIDL